MLRLRSLLAFLPLAARSLRPLSSGGLLDKVGSSLLTQCGVRSGDRLLLCVSGGVDSMALLHLLQELNQSRRLALSLRVLHFNHRRRPEAEEEAVFVRGVAEEYGIPFLLRVLEQTHEVNFQAVAREWRQKASIEALRDWQAEEPKGAASHYVVTAHHMDDLVETLFMRLLRGAHISRLQGVM